MADSTAPSKGWILDASIGVKLFVDDSLSEKAHIFFLSVTSDPDANLYVPDLFYIECTNVIGKYVRFRGLDPEEAKSYIHALEKFVINKVSTASLMADALTIAMENEISAYDACYVALAQRLDLPMVTADHKLVNKLDSSGSAVHFLDDLELAIS